MQVLPVDTAWLHSSIWMNCHLSLLHCFMAFGNRKLCTYFKRDAVREGKQAVIFEIQQPKIVIDMGKKE